MQAVERQMFSFENLLIDVKPNEKLQFVCVLEIFDSKFYGQKSLDSINRSSPPELFLGKDVLKICSKYIGGHPCRSVILIKFSM